MSNQVETHKMRDSSQDNVKLQEIKDSLMQMEEKPRVCDGIRERTN